MFKRRRLPPDITYPLNESDTVIWPSDITIETSSGTWLVKGKKRFKFYSKRVYDSWGFPFPIKVHDSSIEYMEYGGVLGFRNGSLLEDMSDGKLYLISENKRRHIVNPDWLDEYGLMGFPIIVASSNELKLHDEGEPLE